MSAFRVDEIDGYANTPKLPYNQAEEIAVRLFVPDELAADEFRALFKTHYESPVQRLMVAVLEDGLRASVDFLRSTGHKSAKQVHDAYLWVMSRDRSWPFSFESICDALGMDAENFRKLVQAARSRGQIAPGKPIPQKATHHSDRRCAPLCGDGHKLIVSNVYYDSEGKVHCKRCRRLANRQWRQANHGFEPAEMRAERLREQAARMRAAKAKGATNEAL